MIVTEIIRDAKPSDVDRIVDMGMRFLAEGPYRNQLGKNLTAGRTIAAKLMASPEARILVAEEDGKLVGVLAMIVTPHPYSGEMTAQEMIWYVEPEHRRGGIAMKLMWEAERKAKGMGAIRMQFTAPNTELGDLYKRFGYELIEVGYQKSLVR